MKAIKYIEALSHVFFIIVSCSCVYYLRTELDKVREELASCKKEVELLKEAYERN